MADDPVIVTGGSLKLKAKGSIRGLGKDPADPKKEHNLFQYENRDGKKGRLSGYTINDGKRQNLTENDKITIHYEVPD